jgi:aminoglycoside phosphotransferase family enzyme/predicted kinase
VTSSSSSPRADPPPTLPPALAGLLRPQAYSHPVRRIEVLETHISRILLTGQFAYKIKRPVSFPFADLRSLERRRELCFEEVRLNSRFAPGLYLGVCPITLEAGQARIGGDGEPIEYAVRMRQFARADELDRLLAREAVRPEELRAFAHWLASTHAQLAAATAAQPWGEPDRVAAAVLDNLRETRAAAPAALEGLLRGIERALGEALEANRAVMAARKAACRIRECHGDLHTRNIVRRDGRLIPFDCLEFSEALRWIDVADEIAFLRADLAAEHRPLHAHAFLDGYLEASGDYQACRLLRLYGAHRMLVRGKVTALAMADAAAPGAAGRGALEARAASHVREAARLLTPPPPRLVLMSGFAGAGKTWLGQRLAPALDAPQLRSDRERKRLAGLGERDRSGSAPGEALYSRERTEAVYGRLEECAAHCLAGNLSVLVDASFLRRGERVRFARLGAAFAVPVTLVRCTASAQVLRERLGRRAALRSDASEAGLEVLRWQERRAEPIEASEGLTVIEADTTRAQVVSETRARLEERAADR